MPPITIMIKPVSGACGMRCRYCFYADELAARGGANAPMTIDVLEKTVRSAFLYAENSVNVIFQGGEPTLIGADFFEKYITFIKKHNVRGLKISTSLQTNALDISDEMTEIFKRGGFLIGASLDGTRETHDKYRLDASGAGTYDRVTRNIERMREAGIPVNILCVVTRAVAESGKYAFEVLEKYGFLQFIACLDPLNGERHDYSLTAEAYGKFLVETFDAYEDRLRRGKYVSVRLFDNYIAMLRGAPPDSCAMSGKCAAYYVVESDGSVYPCDFYALNEYNMGRITETGFLRLAKTQTASRFLSESRQSGECEKCRHRALCRGGCRRERDDSGLNRLCEGYRYFFDMRKSNLELLAQSYSH